MNDQLNFLNSNKYKNSNDNSSLNNNFFININENRTTNELKEIRNFNTGEVVRQKPREVQESLWEEEPLSFNRIFEALAYLSNKYAKNVSDNSIYFNSPNGKEYMEYSSRTEFLFFKFVEAAIEEIVVDATPDTLSYVSSSVINVKRLYPMESEDEFTVLLKRYLKLPEGLPEILL